VIESLALLGHVPVYTAKAAYSHRRFPLTICLFVCVYPVHSGKMADGILMPFGMIGRKGAGMRQVDGFGDWSRGMGNFWCKCIVTIGDFTNRDFAAYLSESA